MKIVWLGTNDEHGHIRHHHKLRVLAQKEYGVHLIGPGYSWAIGETKLLSDVLPKDTECFVWDERGSGPLRVRADIRPACPSVYVEEDYHFKSRWGIPRMLEPEIIAGSVLRPSPPPGADPWAERKMHPQYDPWIDDPRWRLWPYPVDTESFYPGSDERVYGVGLFGRRGKLYRNRVIAYRSLGTRKDFWHCPPAGAWQEARSMLPKYRYNNDLADSLRKVKWLWVDGANRNIFLGKFHEGIACGCGLYGVKPFGWTSYYPDACMVECPPDQASSMVDGLLMNGHDQREQAWNHCRTHHAVPVRLDQMMEWIHA